MTSRYLDNLTSRYLDNLLNIGNPYFEDIANQIYQPELQLSTCKANSTDIESFFFFFFLDLHLSISNGLVSSIIYDKRDDFDFCIVNFPFMDRRSSFGVNISQPITFARVCNDPSAIMLRT